jgi:hypothetical protein
MNDNTVLKSKSETIGVLEIRSLMEISQTMNKMLTYEEYHRIAAVYGTAIERLLKENGEV